VNCKVAFLLWIVRGNKRK